MALRSTQRPFHGDPGGWIPQGPSDALAVQLSYPNVTDDTEAIVGGRFGDPPENVTVELRRSDGGWASGRVPVAEGAFMTRVALVPSGQTRSSFTLST